MSRGFERDVCSRRGIMAAVGPARQTPPRICCTRSQKKSKNRSSDCPLELPVGPQVLERGPVECGAEMDGAGLRPAGRIRGCSMRAVAAPSIPSTMSGSTSGADRVFGGGCES
jgi:hypothetical protein